MGLFAAKLLIFAPIQFAQTLGFIPGEAQGVTGAVFLQENPELKLRRNALHIFLNLPGGELPNRTVNNVQFGTATSTFANMRPMQLALQNVF